MRKLDFPNVVPECYVDTNLMQSLLKGTVNHQMGCTKVISSLNNALSDRFAIGVIDLDREQHRMTGYLGQCDIVAETRHMTLLKHKLRPQFLITICPAVDKYILDNALENGINLSDYDLPTDLKHFTEVAKQNTSNTDSRFSKLFSAMKDISEISVLRHTLKYLISKQYQAETNVAHDFFIGVLGKENLSEYL
ncbi:MAG: hypothetical protein IJ607_06785 [Bacteroidaceae bacterium]|nr:hypothetical protein [Bacteroidaceae bacterium]